MPRSIKEEAYSLTQLESSSYLTSADATASKWSDLFKYQVPVGQAFVLEPTSKFAAYLDTNVGSSEASVGITRVQIEVRDQSESDKTVIFGPSLYAAIREFQQDDKMARLRVNKPIVVPERFFIVIMVYHTTAIVYAYSYFKLETKRIREGI